MTCTLKKHKRLGITVATVIFILGGLAHLVRLVAGISLTVAGQEVPLPFSAVAVVFAWSMAYWLWCSRDPA
jgi:hypothetical protein